MSTSPLFTKPTPERKPHPLARAGLVGSALAVVIGLGTVFSHSHRAPVQPAGTLLPLDPYASSLQFTDVAMSESTSLSGGKSTFIDGHVHNIGSRTVTAMTVQVPFRNDTGLPPQVETLPLSLIRTHQPYVDTQPIAAAPLAPGDDREFRLIFENINDNWNVQLPEIHPTQVGTR